MPEGDLHNGGVFVSSCLRIVCLDLEVCPTFTMLDDLNAMRFVNILSGDCVFIS
jgi:hypothetical protein